MSGRGTAHPPSIHRIAHYVKKVKEGREKMGIAIDIAHILLDITIIIMIIIDIRRG